MNFTLRLDQDDESSLDLLVEHWRKKLGIKMLTKAEVIRIMIRYSAKRIK